MSFIRNTARILAGAALVGFTAAPIVARAEEPLPQQRVKFDGGSVFLPWRVRKR